MQLFLYLLLSKVLPMKQVKSTFLIVGKKRLALSIYKLNYLNLYLTYK